MTPFSVFSSTADRIWLCLFDGERETDRIPLTPGPGHTFTAPAIPPGTRYGLRADGPWNPAHGLWFDPNKLLVDPHATRLDRPFAFNPRLADPRGESTDTAHLMPKAIVEDLPPPIPPAPPVFKPGGLIYEVPVRPFTLLHPDVPVEIRGTVAALAHPAILDHLTRLGVDAVELMPITAWIDERHLAPLGLTQRLGLQPRRLHGPRPPPLPRRHRGAAHHRRHPPRRTASAPSSTSSSTTPAKATPTAPPSPCAASTPAPTSATSPTAA